MGWSSGSDLAERIEEAISHHCPDLTAEALDALGRKLAEAFEDHDCDTLDECPGFIGTAHNRRMLESAGAPTSPSVGDVFIYWGDIYRFTGTRWEPFANDE